MDAIANSLTYHVNHSISVEDFITLIRQSPLNAAVQTDNLIQLETMLNNADLLISAWNDAQVVGFVRAITDFSSCCYIAELAIHADYHRHGIDRQLMRMVAEELPPECDILFLSTESNHTRYLKLGFSQSPKAWHTNAKNFLDKLNESQ